MSETLAMIENVGCGARDVGRPVLWFDVTGDGWGALQVFNVDGEIARQLLSDVYSVEELHGRMCVVKRENNMVSFMRLLPRAKRRK